MEEYCAEVGAVIVARGMGMYVRLRACVFGFFYCLYWLRYVNATLPTPSCASDARLLTPRDKTAAIVDGRREGERVMGHGETVRSPLGAGHAIVTAVISCWTVK